MNSKMTEKEFIDEVGRRVNAQGYVLTIPIQVSIRDTAREAGLEFAPEPVKLPEILLWRHLNWWVQVDGKASSRLFADLHASERDEIFRTAAERYNAYPGLFKAANLLAGRVGYFLQSSIVDSDVRCACEALNEVLAGGPKP